MSRVLVGIHQLELGGSQLNALDLATGIRDRGHQVEIFAAHTGAYGPMAEIVGDRGIPLNLAEHPRDRPGRLPFRRSVVAALTRAAQRMEADVVHAYEYPLILDAFYGPARSLGTPLIGTVYAMAIPSWLPRAATFVAGTESLVEEARRVGQQTTLIEPPVNTALDDPAAVDGSAFRRRHGIADDEVVLGIVCRLNQDMKQEGIARAMNAVADLDGRLDHSIRLVVTGDGPAGENLSRHAAHVNSMLGRDAIVMSGATADPRPAYAAADMALNMGGSALRAMSFAKPLIVLGIAGFSRPFDETTAAHFFREGFYGIGSGEPDPLAEQIKALMDEKRRRALGDWSRQVVIDRYGLEQAVDTLELVFEEARERRVRWLPAALQTTIQRTTSELMGERVRNRLRPVVRRALVRKAGG
jgi:glycosyltransferase involved in cell wall biosynthesis